MQTELIYIKNNGDDFTLIGELPGSKDVFYSYTLPVNEIGKLEIVKSEKYIFFLDLSDLGLDTIHKFVFKFKNMCLANINFCVIYEVGIGELGEIKEKYDLIDKLQNLLPELDIYMTLKFSFKKTSSYISPELLCLWNKAFKFIKDGNLEINSMSNSVRSSYGENRFNRPLDISSVDSINNSEACVSEVCYLSNSSLFSSSDCSSEKTPFKSDKTSLIKSINWNLKKYVYASPAARAYVRYMTKMYERNLR
ncbi:hypothetical protein EDC55_1175 [Allofrancisella inopinata]|uniref:Uncharacterized protein n=2 Tax=Allofrancisella inopinata TaxID=1085647 RepID=A0AAE6YHA1_9GAMM|nr:hypothetical protein [Allofrancisella inopinata]QIV95407.1 hypothetical protein E4K63_00560 [Allofrancisella inopinata]TDT69248.1 hypothetical protein EDC55_1175 [Allofrancisella inopinata]